LKNRLFCPDILRSYIFFDSKKCFFPYIIPKLRICGGVPDKLKANLKSPVERPFATLNFRRPPNGDRKRFSMVTPAATNKIC